jgi:hypothetical protein
MGVEEPFPQQFFDTARKATAVSQGLGAQWMFIGAVPVAAWGRARATTDAGFAVSLELRAAPDLDREMLGTGFEKTSGPVEIPGKRLILSKYWAPAPGGGLGIDVFYASGYDAGRSLRSALARKVEVAFHDHAWWATTAEDLVVFKVLAFRSRDLDDVATVLERRFDALDWPHVHRWCSELGIGSLLEQIVAEYMKATGREGPAPWRRA